MDSASRLNRKWIKLFVLGAVIIAFVVVFTQFSDRLTLTQLAEQETQLREFQRHHPITVYGIAFWVYVGVAGFSLPVAVPLTLMYGWYFGFTRAVLLVSFGSTAGATVAFLLCRFLFRDAIQDRFGYRLEKFNESLRREGAFYLFAMRLTPAVPFSVINAVMGLTPIRTWTFWWVSQVGMLAGTAVYVYAGSRVPDLATLAEKNINAVFTPQQLFQFLFAFFLLGIFPLAARWTMRFVSRSVKPTTTAE